ncbi:MAG: hypothetical protein PHU42_04325 [Patescibacteria group bacterium]|nr:hypothetical protein [Patescibacteria group bacterium]
MPELAEDLSNTAVNVGVLLEDFMERHSNPYEFSDPYGKYLDEKEGERIIIGRCPFCNKAWDFFIRNGRIGLMPKHNDKMGHICQGSGQDPIQITASRQKKYRAKTYEENVQELKKLLSAA